MKIRLPEFAQFDDDILEENEDCGVWFTKAYPSNDFPFFCEITFDVGYGDSNDSYYMYGFISMQEYYDYAIVTSDDIPLPETKTGKLKKSYIKKAYNIITRQLKERYKQWVMDNIMEGK